MQLCGQRKEMVTNMYICSNGVKTAVILQDIHAESPREPGYQDNITNMVCWHRRYNLGDKHEYKEPRDFAVAMVEKYLKPQDVFRAMVAGELKDFRLIDNEDGQYYSVESKIGFGARERWERMDWKVSRDFEVVEAEDASFDLEMDVLDNCWPSEMVRMCEKHGDVAVLPLYLYDHSGLAMSCGSFVGRAQHAEWDSGQVGYIYMDKETALRELAMPTNEVRLAMPLDGYKAIRLGAGTANFDVVMQANGYTPVALEDLVPSDVLDSIEGQKVAELAVKRELYKKDNRLYVRETTNFVDRQDEEGTVYVASYDIKPIFSYNAGIQPLTEEAWKARALEVLEADVVEYDNYLQDEVYGYKLFEGMDEVESSWGFNPGKGDIEDLMNDELRGWFGADMDFEFDAGDEFDIEEYFENNDFPELRGEIRKMVESQLHRTAQKAERNHEAFPYAASYEDICWNKDNVLCDVIELLYEEHRLPSEAHIHSVFQDIAGISRECMPKITAADLEPDREYTADELSELVREKGRAQGVVQDILDDATARAGGAAGKGHEVENELN